MSIARKPSPWQVSQRPPSTLKLKWPAVKPRVAGLDLLGKQQADRVERLDVRDRVRARRAADRALIDEDHVFELAGAEHVVVLQRLRQVGRVAVFVQPAGEGRVERVVDQRALARAADAGHQAQHAERKLDGDDSCRLLPRAPRSLIQPWAVRAARSAAPMPRRPASQSPVRLSVELLPILAACLETRPSAVVARAGAELDDLVGRRMISSSCSTTTTVLPRSLQLLDRVGQRRDVGRVQADRGLVEHVEHVDQARAERRGEGDALRFAAAERAQRAVERQVADADVDQVREPRADVVDKRPRDRLLPFGQLQLVRRMRARRGFSCGTHRQSSCRRRARRALRAAARAVAGRAWRVRSPAAQEHAEVHLVLAPLQPAEEAVEAAEVSLRHAFDRSAGAVRR